MQTHYSTASKVRSIQGAVAIAVVDVAHYRVTCPCWEWSGVSRRTEDSEGQDEYHDLRATIERTTQNVVVLLVPAGVVPTQPYLGDDTHEYGAEYGRVDTGGQVGGVL